MSIVRPVVIAALLLAAVVTALAVGGRAEATSCPAPGGQQIAFPEASSNGDFVFRGRGFGHGVGMSQWGARGAAELGCRASEILSRYYTGTTVGTADSSRDIRVGIFPNAQSTASRTAYYIDPVTRVTVTNVSTVSLPWRLDGAAQQPPNQPAGATWRVSIRDNGQYRLHRQSGSDWVEVWRGSADGPVRAVLGNGRIARFPTNGISYSRGQLEFQRRIVSGSYRLYVTAHLPSIEQYLYGLAEMPSSWHPQALQAQAIVGRSFAVARRDASGYAENCLCHIYDSTAHQVYSGHNKESEGSNAQWGKRWVAAVDDTARQVLRRTSDNALLSGNYASSHGGHSESAAFVWGSASSHHQPIDDSRWERASNNPNTQWTVRFTAEELGRAFGIGTALEVRLPSPHGASGRIGDPARGAGGMVIEGTNGTARVSGSRARSVLGLRSTLFRVTNPSRVSDNAVAVRGDWNGDGVTNVGWFERGTWRLRLTDGSVRTLTYGVEAGDVPVAGDWNGDGVDGVGIFRQGEWHLRNSLSSSRGLTVHRFEYGLQPGDVPVTGDWDGDGVDGVGIFRQGEWHLRNSLSSSRGRTVHSFVYGVQAGDVPVTGDWNGDEVDGVGIFRRGGEWHLRNSLAERRGLTVHEFVYGRQAGDVPITGDWNVDGRSGPGIVRAAEWHLRNGFSGSTNQRFTWN